MNRIPSSEIAPFMESEGVYPEQAFIADDSYALPSEAWLRDTFAPALGKFLLSFKEGVWTPERNDCDDFSRGSAWFASVLHNNSAPDFLKDTALAFGEFWYEKAGAGGHAINCAIVSNGGTDRRLVFFEPQNSILRVDPIVYLTKEEKALCAGYRW